MDWAAVLAHDVWIQPISIIVGLAILIHTIGYSALVGLAVLLLGIPIQGYLFAVLIGTRQAQMKITDQRVRLLQEILTGIRVIKCVPSVASSSRGSKLTPTCRLMAYEEFFGDRVSDFRRQELRKLTRNCLARATMSSVMSFIPVFAAVLSFVSVSSSTEPQEEIRRHTLTSLENQITYSLSGSVCSLSVPPFASPLTLFCFKPRTHGSDHLLGAPVRSAFAEIRQRE